MDPSQPLNESQTIHNPFSDAQSTHYHHPIPIHDSPTDQSFPLGYITRNSSRSPGSNNASFHEPSRHSAFAAPSARIVTTPLSENRKPVKPAPFKSNALLRDTDGNANIPKPWLLEKNPYLRISYFLTWTAFLAVGLGGSFLNIFFSIRALPKTPKMCLVLEDNFDSFNTDVWKREVDLSGYGNHHFDMTTESETNSYVKDGKLYITPTLTGDTIGYDNLLNGGTFNLTGCTNVIVDPATGAETLNPDACGVVSNSTTGTMIPPIMSARLNTKGRASIRYGKVSVRAKLPRGDWLWPAIWLLPENNTYGPWPMSGEIDIMESRGNDNKYPRGRNFIQSSLNWGPTTFINAVWKTYGFWFERRDSYDRDFHEYTLEWTEDYLRMSVDTRLHASYEINFNKPFFDRGDFPRIVTNDTQQMVLENPWKGRGNSAPFDQPFYLIMNVAVGGTNGWFEDSVGNKPWLDKSKTSMIDFWSKRDDWLPTWGTPEDHSMIIDSVKMWQVC